MEADTTEERALAVEQHGGPIGIHGDVPDAERVPQLIGELGAERRDRRVLRDQLQAEDVQGREGGAPEVCGAEQERQGRRAGMARRRQVDLAVQRGERIVGVGDQGTRVRIQDVVLVDTGGVDRQAQARGGRTGRVLVAAAEPRRMPEGDVDVDGVEVRDDVRAGDVRRGRRLHPHRAGDAAVVPPVDDAPRDDVAARPERDGVDADGQDVLLARTQGVTRLERERRRAALVVAEPRPVEPHVGDIVRRSELHHHRLATPRTWHREGVPVPRAALLAVGRRVCRARHGDGLPGAVVVVRQVAPVGLGLDRAQAAVARRHRQRRVDVGRLDEPLAVEIEPRPRLPRERGHGHPVLHRDGQAKVIGNRQGRRERAGRGCRQAAAQQAHDEHHGRGQRESHPDDDGSARGLVHSRILRQ